MALQLILILYTLIWPVMLAPPPAQAPLFSPPETGGDHGPNVEHARTNAPRIFNAIHSSMRQWGSSLLHNGMSLYPARIPNNTHLYHGTDKSNAVKGMEWLAFEIEHAEMFARARGPPRKGRRPGKPGGPEHPGEPGDGRGPPPMELDWAESLDEVRSMDDDDDDDREEGKGYLHIYRTTRPLSKLVYIEGMSAGKTDMGTLDTQDIFLRNSSDGKDKPAMSDYQRALDLCALGAEWGIEGFIRMEMGFEIVFCEFSDGLVLESARERPGRKNNTYAEGLTNFEVLRGASQRYHGITAQRLKLDYSGMVSAFWYNLNLTNPDPERPDLPRLPASNTEGIARMKADLKTAFEESTARADVGNDWQGVADMIVLRYSDRLKFLAANDTSRETILMDIAVLLNLYIDYANFDVPTAIEKCSTHYLIAAVPQTTSDHMIYEALLTVTNKICTTLFYVGDLLLEEEDAADNSALNLAKSALQTLIDYLDWTTWRECGKCAYDELCFVAIWPWGTEEDHKNPSCMKNDVLGTRYGYWHFGERF